MADIDALRARAMASMPLSSRRNLINPAPDGKEEGELSSSSEKEMSNGASGGAQNGVSLPTEDLDQERHNIDSSTAINSVNDISAKCAPSNAAPSSSNLEFHNNPPQRKSSHVASGWHRPPLGDKNLVINFSDGSEGESDESGYAGAAAHNNGKVKSPGGDAHKIEHLRIMKGSGMPQLNKAQTRTMPRHLAANRTFASAVSKLTGKPSGRPGVSAYGRGAQIFKMRSQSKNAAANKRPFNQVVDSNSQVLESLRQQIALKENELKHHFKAVPLGKQTPSGSEGELHTLKELHIVKPKASRLVDLGIAANDSENKRQKTGGNSLIGIDSDLKKKPVLDSKKKRDDEQSAVSVTAAVTGCNAFYPSKMSSEKMEDLNQNCMVEDNIPNEISISKKQSFLGQSQLNKIGDAHEPDPSSQHGLSRNTDHVSVVAIDNKQQLASSTPHDVSSRSRNFPFDEQLTLFSKNNPLDIRNLLELEELQDKKLEEAQELRRKCELEERTARKAYRLAQRALIDSNEKCSHLYRERELLSAQIQAYMVENSCSIWPPTQHKLDKVKPVSFENITGFDVNLLPSSSCQVEIGQLDQIGPCDSQLAGYDSAPAFANCNPELVCKPSTSALERSLINDRAPCASSKMCIKSAIMPVIPSPSKSTFQFRLACDGVEEAAAYRGGNFTKEEQVNNSIEIVPGSIIYESSAKSQAAAHLSERLLSTEDNKKLMTSSFEECNQDGSLLEVSLRNELFARRGMRDSSNKSGPVSSQKSSHYGASQTIVEMNKTDALHKPLSLSLSNEERLVEINYPRVVEKGVHTAAHVHVNGNYKPLLTDDRSSQSGGLEESSTRGQSDKLISSVLRIPSSHVKVVCKHLQKHDVLDSCERILPDKESTREVHNTGEAPINFFKKVDDLDSPYGNHIDPFWPHCIFELRGKCNSDECPWQHIRDYSERNSGRPCFSSSSDYHVPSSSDGEECEYACGNLRCRRCCLIPIPVYRIGSCLLRAEPTSSRYIQSVWQYGRVGFCNSFGTPIAVTRIFPPDNLYPSLGVGHIEDHAKWSQSSLLRQTIEDRVTQQTHSSNDSEQSMELALEYFMGNINRKEGRKKALAVLSRSIEADPNSVGLWVSYLHIFFEKEKTLGEDDMFLRAIQLNEESYELWIMYINSRIEYQSCLDAHETAVKSFVSFARSSDKDSHAFSVCLLDLTLRMIDFLRMSGNIDKAISFVDGFLPSTVELASPSKSTALEVFACLNAHDKCILLVCSVYFLVYKKLPETIVEMLNFEQQLPFNMEWPFIHLTDEEKQSAVDLMEFALSTEMLGANSVECALEGATRPIQFLAISHVKFVMMIEDLEHGKLLLYKYNKMYPFCTELALMRARMQQEECTERDSYTGFEEVLQSWPKKVPGFHCIWNQYLEFALDSGMTSLANELIMRWFCAFEEGQSDHGQPSDSDCSSETSYSAEIHSQPHAHQRDELFRLLNLSLYQYLHSKEEEVLGTVDEALSATSEEDFAHCAKEHASLKMGNSQEPSIDSIALLLSYLTDHRAVYNSINEPLSRRFISSIRKPRIRYLVNKLMGASSVRPFLMNSILEVLYGTSLIPENTSAQKLVEFVEGLMQIYPANYELGLSVCKVILKIKLAESSASSVMFWASSVLVNSILQAFPIAPEHFWIEAIFVLGKLGTKVILKRFYQFALSVHPFSVNLWQSYIDFCKVGGNVSDILEAVEERGIASNFFFKY